MDHLVPGRAETGEDDLWQPLLAEGLEGGELAGDRWREGGQARGQEGRGQGRHSLQAWKREDTLRIGEEVVNSEVHI